MCSKKNSVKKKVGRGKPTSGDRKLCTWCRKNIGGRASNPRKIALRMARHLILCSIFQALLDIYSIVINEGENEERTLRNVLKKSHELGGPQYNFD